MSTPDTLPQVDQHTSGDTPIILHVDCDCFYAACERLREAELEDKPVIIGMGYDEENPSGAVATASYEAREYGVESAMAISEALDRLPRKADADTANDDDVESEMAYYRPVDMEYYESIGDDVQSILDTYAETLEPVSIDEAYLDVTSQTEWGDVERYIETVKQAIESEVGVPVSVGAAPTKSAAKVASDHDKPDGKVIVRPGEVREFFAPLDIEAIHGIGPVTARKLRDMGIETAGDLAETDPKTITDEFGTRGGEAYQRARGYDPREVTPPDDPKSISNESSFPDPVSDWRIKETKIELIAEKVTRRAREQNALYRTIGVKAVEPPFEVNTRAHTLPGPINDEDLVESVAIELLEEFREQPLRKIGVKVSNLSFSEQTQAKLAEWRSEAGGSKPFDEWKAEKKQAEESERQATITEYDPNR